MKLARMAPWSIFVSTLFAVGCISNQYEIELTPSGDTIEREIKCWRSGGASEEERLTAFPDAELKRIAAAYGGDVPVDPAEKHRFVKRFTDQMPDDVGNSGTYTHWKTTLGSMSGYVERVRGEDDLLTIIQLRQDAANRVTDHLIGWLRMELSGQAGIVQLCEFLDNHFRRDLTNLSLYVWAHDLAVGSDEEAQPEYFARIWQYLVERSYVAPQKLPELARAVSELERDDPTRLLAIIQRFTASKMGIAESQPVPDSLQFLADSTAIESSLNGYLRQTDAYRALVARWEQEKLTQPDATKPEPGELLGDDIERILMPNLSFGRIDQVNVKLAVTNPPFLTNGQWDEESGKVVWSKTVLEADSELSESPMMLFALWSNPHKDVQKEHFGQVVLEDEQLGEYCLWYRGLAPQEAEQWDTFIAGLQPGDELIDKLEAFRFAHERSSDDEDAPDLASIPRRSIVGNLRREE